MAENPTPTPGEFEREVGSGDQLAYGEASELNAALAKGDAIEETIASQGVLPEQPISAADPPIDYGDDPPEFEPGAGEFDDVLFADPVPGLEPKKKTSKRPLPNSVIRMLPTMSAIVKDPATPPSIKAAYLLMIRKLEEEMRAKG